MSSFILSIPKCSPFFATCKPQASLCPSFFPLYIYFHMIQSCHFHFLSILLCLVTLYLHNTYYLMSRYYKNKSLISLQALFISDPSYSTAMCTVEQIFIVWSLQGFCCLREITSSFQQQLYGLSFDMAACILKDERKWHRPCASVSLDDCEHWWCRQGGTIGVDNQQNCWGSKVLLLLLSWPQPNSCLEHCCFICCVRPPPPSIT